MTSEQNQPTPAEIFDAMQERTVPVEHPRYLEWWENRANENYMDVRIRNIVNGLTRVAIRGLEGDAEYTDKEPALQARYWYRSLGPLNPMADIEPDLIQAAKMMYGKETPNPKESANLQLDSAYSLFDLALITKDPQTRHQALMLGLQATRRIEGRENFDQQQGSYRLQTAILKNDIKQALIRSKEIGSLGPTELPHELFAKYETVFAQQELNAIGEFGKYVKDEITDENFGVLFEWYFILAERFRAWDAQTIDTQVVRGATSRENAEWTGEDELHPNRVTANHDVVASKLLSNGRMGSKRYQLKAVIGENMRQYDPKITIIDYQALFKDRFRNIDSATSALIQNLRQFQAAYRGSLNKL